MVRSILRMGVQLGKEREFEEVFGRLRVLARAADLYEVVLTFGKTQ